MCGIQCCAGLKLPQGSLQNNDWCQCSINNNHRGPDSAPNSSLSPEINENWRADFAGYVLWTQGDKVTPQPFCSSNDNILLWNGDIFSGKLAPIPGKSDTEALSEALSTSSDVLTTMSAIQGPYSFIYYRKDEQKLYFGRDPIGRHSLLIKIRSEEEDLIISSVASKNAKNFVEIPAIGIFVVDMTKNSLNLGFHPWRRSENHSGVIEAVENKLNIKIDTKSPIFDEKLIKTFLEPTNEDLTYLTAVSGLKNYHEIMERLLQVPEIIERVDKVLELLRDSVRLRIERQPEFCKDCVRIKLENGEDINCEHSKVGFLFSGGLDSTILAAIASEFIGKGEVVDLINVAFEKAKKERAESQKIKGKGKKSDKNEDNVVEVINYDVPDRKTGRLAFGELKKIFPERKWNFIECNITQKELEKYRSEQISHLIYPLRTILDESVGCALWFAARGSGCIPEHNEVYESPCRFLLLGMGADELFGGYTRHRNALKRRGWIGLAEELDKEISRIAERNLGRDDRVVSDHGRQSRLPYLDERFVDYVTGLPVWQRCCPLESMPPGLGDKLLLRLCAYKLGLKETATFPKRAFQFGSRIAKSHENAADESQWLR